MKAVPAPANKAAGNGRLHKTRTRTGRTGARNCGQRSPQEQDQAAPAPATAGNGRHKNKNQAAPAPTGNGRLKTRPTSTEAATARARDLAPRARETDASIPSGRAGTDECADAD